MASVTEFESSSLYVGDLDSSVSESDLYEIFSQVGNVVSILVCRHAVTRLSLGYGHVCYSNAQEAQEALKLLNFALVNGKPMRIVPACHDSHGRKSGIGNIFIKNLEKSITSKELLDTFSAFGFILSCKVEMDAAGQSKGYGFVQFQHEEAAQNAIQTVNGMLLNDKQVFVGPFVPRQQRDHSNGDASRFSNVFVKNFAETTTDEALWSHFAAFGEITSAVVMRDSAGQSKRFGFVNFKDTDGAARAVEALNGKTIEEREWYVGRAQKKYEREAELRAKYEQGLIDRIQHAHRGVSLYLTDLDVMVDDETLRDLFAEFGVVTSSIIMRNSEGRSTGSGLVNFATPDEANSALANMNGRMVGTKALCVAPAQSTEERHARLQMHTSAGIDPAVPTFVPVYQTDPPEFGEPIDIPYQSGQPLPGPPQFTQPNSYHNGQPLPGYTHPTQPVDFPYQLQMIFGIRPVGPNVPIQNQPGGSDPNLLAPVLPRQNQPGGGEQNLLVGIRPGGEQNYYLYVPYATTQHQPGGGNPNIIAPVVPRQDRHGRGGHDPHFHVSRQNQQGQHQLGGGTLRQPRQQRPRQRPRRQPVQHPEKEIPPRRRPRRRNHRRRAPIDAGVPQEGATGGTLDVESNLADPTADDAMPQSVQLCIPALASLPVEERPETLGELLYPLVYKLEHERAGKVTGMLLEMDLAHILHLLESPEELMAKVTEFTEVLRLDEARAAAPTGDTLMAKVTEATEVLRIDEARAAAPTGDALTAKVTEAELTEALEGLQIAEARAAAPTGDAMAGYSGHGSASRGSVIRICSN